MPSRPVIHRNKEHDEAGFDVLRDMQSKHFWYQGRHRFLLRALKEEVSNQPGRSGLSAVDLGGGCGGWISYLKSRFEHGFSELALADSSLRALELAGPVIPRGVNRYQIDLYSLGWESKWDVAFLLDVLEHLPEDALVLREIQRALRPGGLLFVTTPALKFFWSYNDEIAHHVRRYARKDFLRLGAESGLVLKNSRYFMFLLSPLLWLSRRLTRRDVKKMTPDQMRILLQRTHRVPPKALNGLLRLIFSLETPLGLQLPFPWGTSILGVFQKKA
jgi:SAM-dependent methyltransferase